MDRKIKIRTKEDHPEVKRPKETIVELPERGLRDVPMPILIL